MGEFLNTQSFDTLHTEDEGSWSSWPERDQRVLNKVHQICEAGGGRPQFESCLKYWTRVQHTRYPKCNSRTLVAAHKAMVIVECTVHPLWSEHVLHDEQGIKKKFAQNVLLLPHLTYQSGAVDGPKHHTKPRGTYVANDSTPFFEHIQVVFMFVFQISALV